LAAEEIIGKNEYLLNIKLIFYNFRFTFIVNNKVNGKGIENE